MTKRAAAPTHLTEIVPPRLNDKTPAAVENLLQALALGREERFALEVTGEPGRVRFLVRSPRAEMHAHLLGQLRLAYPQAACEEVAAEDDPFALASGERASAELGLQAGIHLPLRTYRDRDWTEGGADPVLALLAALGDLSDGERAACQLVLTPARSDWSRGLERLALENPVQLEQRLQAERMRARASHSPIGGGPILAGLGLLAGWLQARAWLEQGEVWALVLAGGGLLVGLPLVLALLRRLTRPRSVYDPRLVADKIGRVGYTAHLRLLAIAPDRARANARLRQLIAAYQQFSLATGNGLVAGRWAGDPRRLEPAGRAPWRPLPILNVREAASLWHLPQGADEVPFLRRTSARRLLPVPTSLVRAEGCPIGVARHQGRAIPVALPSAALARNALLVAKTGKGKSTLMEHMALWQAARREACVVVVDPHGDLARGILAGLPGVGVHDVAYVDFAERVRPVGLNLLDVHLGRGRDKTVANVIDVFSRVWERFWGPRMEDALRYCLLVLCAVNAKVAPDRQYGVLHVKRLLTDDTFRRTLLTLVDDRDVKDWWNKDFALMPKSFAQEVVKPVLTKLNRFAGSEAARDILGQPRTTLNLRALVRERRVLLVNTATGPLGPGTAGLLGATLLDLLALTIMEQSTLPPEQRVPVRVFVDEFQAIPAVDYAELLGQLRKFGASFTLATQALARLDGADPTLRGVVFGNVDTLGVFQVSAEDARYLKDELDGLVDETDLTNLPDYHCYLKTVGAVDRERTCLVETLPPAGGDPDAARVLALGSAARYGRPVAEIEELRRTVGRQHHPWAEADRQQTQAPATERVEQLRLGVETLPGAQNATAADREIRKDLAR